MKTATLALGVLTTAAMTSAAWGHGSGHKNAEKKPARALEEKSFGRAGDPKAVTRTVTFHMTDKMRFDPSRITVSQGETIRFVARNNGKIMHEMVIGTMKELREHAEQMKKFPGMEHDEPYMTHVEPGKSGEIVWQFTRVGNFDFACLIAGHFDAGMMGTIVVAPAKPSR